MDRLTIWLNKLVKIVVVVAACYPPCLFAQQMSSLSLQQAFELAEKNYPLIRQRDLLKQTEKLTIENLHSGFLPQLAFNVQGTYQSDVTRVDIPIPGVKVPSQSRDQYKVVAEVSQLLYDGGLTRSQQNLQNLNTAVEEKRLEVELYNVKTRVSQVYFAILYQDELLNQARLVQKDIEAGIDKVSPQVQNGVALRSNLLVLQAQLLQAKQKASEIAINRKGLLDVLGLFINQAVPTGGVLQVTVNNPTTDTVVERPEIKMFQSQSQLLAGQQQLIRARNLPKAAAFVQGGYGRPALNLLSNEFKPFYITGIRLNWSLGGLYNANRDKRLTDLNRQSVDVQKDVFLLNTRSQLKQQKADIEKFAELVNSDKEIIQLRRQITTSAEAQLENAVITANDYLLQVNAEDAARQALILHQIQLQQATVNYAITLGNM